MDQGTFIRPRAFEKVVRLHAHHIFLVLSTFLHFSAPFDVSVPASTRSSTTYHLQELHPVVSGLQTLRYSGIAYRTNAVPPPVNAHVAVKRTRRS